MNRIEDAYEQPQSESDDEQYESDEEIPSSSSSSFKRMKF
jgi:hypothetical protein